METTQVLAAIILMWIGLEIILLCLIFNNKEEFKCPYGCDFKKSNRKGTEDDPNFYG